MRLLLVDDHQLLRQSLRRQLEEWGHEIVGEASRGAEATTLALRLRPDVILMDISLSEGDGISATREIMQADARQRIVMLTMHIDSEMIRDSLKAGAVGYVTKDCSIDEVVTAIDLAHNGDTVISPKLAEAMLRETHNTIIRQECLITDREEQVLQLLVDGLSTPEIAARLYISQKTVKNHLFSIYEKLDARDRTQAAISGLKMGIVKLN